MSYVTGRNDGLHGPGDINMVTKQVVTGSTKAPAAGQRTGTRMTARSDAGSTMTGNDRGEPTGAEVTLGREIAKLDNALINALRPAYPAIDASPLPGDIKAGLKTAPLDTILISIFQPIHERVIRSVAKANLLTNTYERGIGIRGVNFTKVNMYVYQPELDKLMTPHVRQYVRRVRAALLFMLLVVQDPLAIAVALVMVALEDAEIGVLEAAQFLVALFHKNVSLFTTARGYFERHHPLVAQAARVLMNLPPKPEWPALPPEVQAVVDQAVAAGRQGTQAVADGGKALVDSGTAVINRGTDAVRSIMGYGGGLGGYDLMAAAAVVGEVLYVALGDIWAQITAAWSSAIAFINIAGPAIALALIPVAGGLVGAAIKNGPPPGPGAGSGGDAPPGTDPDTGEGLPKGSFDTKGGSGKEPSLLENPLVVAGGIGLLLLFLSKRK